MPHTLIAVPCMPMIHTDFVSSLLTLNRPDDTSLRFRIGSLVYNARNAFAAEAISSGYDRVLFVDSDMILQPDTLTRLAAHMGPADLVSALAFTRSVPIRPVIYKPSGNDVIPYTDYPRNATFPIAAAGFGCVLIRTSLLKAVWDKFGPPFTPTSALGEDLAFCARAHDLGACMLCDSSVSVGHIGNVVFSEQQYLSQQEGDTH